jgi:hypothetical protein
MTSRDKFSVACILAFICSLIYGLMEWWISDAHYLWISTWVITASIFLLGAIFSKENPDEKGYCESMYIVSVFGFCAFLCIFLFLAFGNGLAVSVKWAWLWLAGAVFWAVGAQISGDLFGGIKRHVPQLLDPCYAAEPEENASWQSVATTPEAEAIFSSPTEFSDDLIRRMIEANPDKVREELTAFYNKQAREVRMRPAPQL